MAFDANTCDRCGRHMQRVRDQRYLLREQLQQADAHSRFQGTRLIYTVTLVVMGAALERHSPSLERNLTGTMINWLLQIIVLAALQVSSTVQ